MSRARTALWWLAGVLVLILVGTLVTGLGLLDSAVAIALWLLALLSAITVLQRILAVRRQALG